MTGRASSKGRRAEPRQRLVAAMVAVANREGYAKTSVVAVAKEAGVSKPTFYEHFSSKEDCFLGALGDVQEELLGEIARALAARRRDPLLLAVGAVLDFAERQPALARFLLNEPLGAGTPALDTRDGGVQQIARLIEARTSSRIDVPAGVVLGGTFRLLAARLRRGERAGPSLREGVQSWLESYGSEETPRWQKLRTVAGLSASEHLPSTPFRPPEPLPKGRSRLSDPEVQHNRRLRIMFAAASLAAEKGYAGSTTTEIAKRARVDLRAFYSLFAEKQEAFMAVHELGFQDVIAVAAVAFFAGESWPERSWEAGRAFTQFLEANPTIVNVGFVEAYAVGPGAAQRIEDSHVAFTVFLQEGLQHADGEPPSRLAMEAIVNSIFEIVYRQVRSAPPLILAGLLANIAQLWLTPFLGPEDTNRFIESQIARETGRTGT